MKTKANITVGVIEKVKEYYVAKSLLGGMIKVDRLVKSDHFGDEIHVYYEDINQFDRYSSTASNSYLRKRRN